MNPWIQIICFMAIPAILVEVVLRYVIENVMLRAMVAGLVNAGATAIAAKMMGPQDPMLAGKVMLSLLVGIVLALISAGVRGIFRR